MSDYLWDKRGEPDAEVARLEALLGAFAHEPRPLELPVEAATRVRRPAWLPTFAARLRASRLFAPAALAAVVLLVATILVASVFLRTRTTNESGHDAARESAPPPPSAPKDERPAPREVGRMLEPPPPVGGVNGGKPSLMVKDEKVAVESLPRVARRRKDAQVTSVSRRQQRDMTASAVTDEAVTGFTFEALRAGSASSFVESTRLLTKEQLVYALRLTGAKLKDVRERAQGLDESKSQPR
jgi:hypothetical protein